MSVSSETPPPEKVTLAIEGWNARDLHSRAVFERSLQSILDQSYPVRRCQILVLIDSGASEEETEWIRQALPQVEIVGIEGLTYYRTKNHAMTLAKGEVLVFADSDVRYVPDWLEQMLGCIQAGNPVVVGNTQYELGPLSRTLDLCDWAASRIGSGPTRWLYGNNLALRREMFESIRFRSDMGKGGGGAVNVLQDELQDRGIRPWFCEAARAWHQLPRFWVKRFRIGAFHVMTRRKAPELEWSWTARVPILAPFLVSGGMLIRAYQRAWRLRSTLPARGLSLPAYLLTIAFVKGVEFLGAAMVTWAPGYVGRRYGWFDVPEVSSSPAATPA